MVDRFAMRFDPRPDRRPPPPRISLILDEYIEPGHKVDPEDLQFSLNRRARLINALIVPLRSINRERFQSLLEDCSITIMLKLNIKTGHNVQSVFTCTLHEYREELVFKNRCSFEHPTKHCSGKLY